MGGTPRQTFRMDEILWAKFQAKCAAKGYTASDVLRAFIMKVNNGDISPDSVKPSGSRKGEQLAKVDDAFLKWLNEDSHRTKKEDT